MLGNEEVEGKKLSCKWFNINKDIYYRIINNGTTGVNLRNYEHTC
jgi:hypothetical protein